MIAAGIGYVATASMSWVTAISMGYIPKVALKTLDDGDHVCQHGRGLDISAVHGLCL